MMILVSQYLTLTLTAWRAHELFQNECVAWLLKWNQFITCPQFSYWASMNSLNQWISRGTTTKGCLEPRAILVKTKKNLANTADWIPYVLISHSNNHVISNFALCKPCLFLAIFSWWRIVVVTSSGFRMHPNTGDRDSTLTNTLVCRSGSRGLQSISMPELCF